jgi:hypothetical protein
MTIRKGSTVATVPVELSDGTTFLATLTDVRGETEVAWKPYDLKDLIAAIRGLSRELLDQITSLACDSAEITFGFAATVEEGKLAALLVSAGAEATVEVTLRWSRSGVEQ